jgi:CHAD domain-containing protein
MSPYMGKPNHSEAHAGAAGMTSPLSAPGEAIRPATSSTFDELNAPEIERRVLKLALKQLDRLVALESKVLRDESIEPAHNLRVSSRRLQGLIDFLYPAPAPNGVRKLRRRLKKARQVLGELRNQDVLASRIERTLARKRTSHRAAWEAARDYVGKLRPKTAQRAHRKLTRLNLSELYLRLRRELTDRSPGEAPEGARVITFRDDRPAADPLAIVEPALQAHADVTGLAGRFSDHLNELWRDFEVKAAASHEDASGLHALRISAKRLRYLVEVAAELEATGSREALACLRNLQGRLGDWHDDQVLGSTMLQMVARRTFLEEQLPLAIQVEQLVLTLRRSKTRACQRYLRHTFKSPEYRRMSDWVGQRAARRSLPTA